MQCVIDTRKGGTSSKKSEFFPQRNTYSRHYRRERAGLDSPQNLAKIRRYIEPSRSVTRFQSRCRLWGRRKKKEKEEKSAESAARRKTTPGRAYPRLRTSPRHFPPLLWFMRAMRVATGHYIRVSRRGRGVIQRRLPDGPRSSSTRLQRILESAPVHTKQPLPNPFQTRSAFLPPFRFSRRTRSMDAAYYRQKSFLMSYTYTSIRAFVVDVFRRVENSKDVVIKFW